MFGPGAYRPDPTEGPCTCTLRINTGGSPLMSGHIF